jgi:hypothetical protein
MSAFGMLQSHATMNRDAGRCIGPVCVHNRGIAKIRKSHQTAKTRSVAEFGGRDWACPLR